MPAQDPIAGVQCIEAASVPESVVRSGIGKVDSALETRPFVGAVVAIHIGAI
jgi:hypothetical protein